MDITNKFLEVAEASCSTNGVTQDRFFDMKRQWMLKPVKDKSAFAKAAEDVGKNVTELSKFINSTKKNYLLAGRYSKVEKDKIEQEVGQTVKQCGRQIDMLKNTVVAAQQSPPAPAAAALGIPVNQQTAAHLHGMVLILVERLQAVSAHFDKCRAVRYQKQAAHMPKVTYKPEMSTSGFGSSSASTSTSAAAMRSNGVVSSSGSSNSSSNGTAAVGQLQQLMTPKLEQDTRALLEELTSTAQGVFHAEKAMREIATLNDMLSTAVMHQAEQIEQLYHDTINATFNIKRGNESLGKTIDVNRSSRLYMVVLLLMAIFGLVFYDWFNS